MNIYLARHGTTEWNSRHLIQGRTDIELDDLGVEMARQTGERLAQQGISFDHIFSSPLKRAYKTALLISGINCSEKKIITDSCLTELGFGDFEGRNVEMMISDPECIFRYFKTAPDRYNDEISSHGSNPAETLTSLLERTASFVRDTIEPLIPTTRDDVNILISGHGAVNKALLMYFERRTDLSGFWGKGLQPNCGINKISCTRTASGEIVYDVQDDCLVLYDSALKEKTSKLL